MSQTKMGNMIFLLSFCGQAQSQTVALPRERGVTAPHPIALKSMQNTPFLALLRPIFALKTKLAPPLTLAMRIGKGPDVI